MCSFILNRLGDDTVYYWSEDYGNSWFRCYEDDNSRDCKSRVLLFWNLPLGRPQGLSALTATVATVPGFIAPSIISLAFSSSVCTCYFVVSSFVVASPTPVQPLNHPGCGIPQSWTRRLSVLCLTYCVLSQP
jgi:hypothetical protein